MSTPEQINASCSASSKSDPVSHDRAADHPSLLCVHKSSNDIGFPNGLVKPPGRLLLPASHPTVLPNTKSRPDTTRAARRGRFQRVLGSEAT
jgi:hypothetical protein